MPTLNSCAKCACSTGIIHDRTPACNPVSWAWMHGCPYNWTYLWFASYVGDWCAWLIFWHVIHGCLHNQAPADVRSTSAGVKCLYCISVPLYKVNFAYDLILGEWVIIPGHWGASTSDLCPVAAAVQYSAWRVAARSWLTGPRPISCPARDLPTLGTLQDCRQISAFQS